MISSPLLSVVLFPECCSEHKVTPQLSVLPSLVWGSFLSAVVNKMSPHKGQFSPPQCGDLSWVLWWTQGHHTTVSSPLFSVVIFPEYCCEQKVTTKLSVFFSSVWWSFLRTVVNTRSTHKVQFSPPQCGDLSWVLWWTQCDLSWWSFLSTLVNLRSPHNCQFSPPQCTHTQFGKNCGSHSSCQTDNLCIETFFFTQSLQYWLSTTSLLRKNLKCLDLS